MIFEIPKEAIITSLIKQLSSFFNLSANEINTLNTLSEEVFKRCEINFLENRNKYYSKEKQAYFNPYHSGQYNVFLYYFSNTVFKEEKNQEKLADKLYYLNKIMNSCDLFYEVELPDFFMLDQPVGAVLGRAKYGDFFIFTQGCTVGSNKGISPIIGNHVTMAAHSKVFGNSNIGKNTILGVDACVKDENIPDNSLVFGQSPNLIIKKRITNKLEY
jgi:serine O-acetyltransferase